MFYRLVNLAKDHATKRRASLEDTKFELDGELWPIVFPMNSVRVIHLRVSTLNILELTLDNRLFGNFDVEIHGVPVIVTAKTCNQ